MPVFSKITRFQTHVNRPDRIAELTSRALDLALAERGPVQINIPRDYFYGVIDVEVPRPVPIERSAGGPQSLEAATEALKGARFPVIVAGGGVIFSHGTEEAVALAEQLGAPVVSSYLHNDSFPNSHELYCGPLGYQGSKAAMRILAQADVVLALGTRLGPFGTLPQYGIEYWPKEARIVQVDPDHRMIGLTKKVDVGVVADAKLAAELSARLQNQPLAGHATRAARQAEASRQKAAWEEELGGMSSAPGLPVAPRRALRELEKAMPRDAMVTTDIGNVCSVANSYLRFERPTASSPR